MGRRLSCGFDSIVAGDAALRGAGMIEPVDHPLAGCVTGVAFGLGDNVVCRFAMGPHVIVTAGAISRRPLEDGIAVARLARDGHMRAGKRETCRKMIECRFAGGGCGRTRDDRHCEHRSQERCMPSPDHANPDSLFPDRAWAANSPIDSATPAVMLPPNKSLLSPRTATGYY